MATLTTWGTGTSLTFSGVDIPMVVLNYLPDVA